MHDGNNSLSDSPQQPGSLVQGIFPRIICYRKRDIIMCNVFRWSTTPPIPVSDRAGWFWLITWPIIRKGDKRFPRFWQRIWEGSQLTHNAGGYSFRYICSNETPFHWSPCFSTTLLVLLSWACTLIPCKSMDLLFISHDP